MHRRSGKWSAVAVSVILAAPLEARAAEPAAAPPAQPAQAAPAGAPRSAKICLGCHQPQEGTLRGHWESVSMKASSIQLKIDGGAEVVKFDPASLEVLNAKAEDDLEDKLRGIKRGHEVRIAYVEKDGAKLAKVVAVKPPVKLAAEEKVSLAELQKLVAKGPAMGRYHLFDARPAPRFKEGAIPTAVSLPFPEFDKLTGRLPAEKDSLIVFYCSGVTCNMSPGAQRKAKALGYTNAKVFVEGMPAWYQQGHGVLSAQHYLEAYQELPHVLLDVRKPAAAKAGFLRGAVAADDRIVRGLPAKELKAPIVVYDEDGKGGASRLAAKIVRAGYVNVNVLSDGLAGAKLAGAPLEAGALGTKVAYAPKPKPGELPLDEFRGFLTAIPAGTVVVDVRNADELEDGTVAGAVNVPVDQMDAHLDRLPKDKRIVTFCGTGTRAEMAYHSLRARGYGTVAFLNAKVEFEDGKATLSR